MVVQDLLLDPTRVVDVLVAAVALAELVEMELMEEMVAMVVLVLHHLTLVHQ
jgi:hypothetical protein